MTGLTMSTYSNSKSMLDMNSCFNTREMAISSHKESFQHSFKLGNRTTSRNLLVVEEVILKPRKKPFEGACVGRICMGGGDPSALASHCSTCCLTAGLGMKGESLTRKTWRSYSSLRSADSANTLGMKGESLTRTTGSTGKPGSGQGASTSLFASLSISRLPSRSTSLFAKEFVSSREANTLGMKGKSLTRISGSAKEFASSREATRWWRRKEREREMKVHASAGERPEVHASADGQLEEGDVGTDSWMRTADPYEVLGVCEGCDLEEVRTAFRARVKEYHPDVYSGTGDAAAITRRVLRAYELLLDGRVKSTITRKRSEDPFGEPEGEADQVFVNELNCIGMGCPYSCVKRAPNTFRFSSTTGRARSSFSSPLLADAGNDDSYDVFLAVGQCPSRCIHYVTEGQREVLDELMQRASLDPFSANEVGTLLEALLARASFENGRDRSGSKRTPKRSDEWVDWF
eukprot:TRINITY_DN17170_c0_g1_i1.p1 TRINITY_DN17170_c0_g1~~TRINITY_DN17170_c0_g1_i1.p1  ORF type:complete len:462 (+),score=49.10 TRINITY_DN17170_c0_g1_i1:757-2142(+)